MNSKKYEMERERQKSPIMSKTSETDKSSGATKRLSYSKFGGFSGVKSEIGNGFYRK